MSAVGYCARRSEGKKSIALALFNLVLESVLMASKDSGSVLSYNSSTPLIRDCSRISECLPVYPTQSLDADPKRLNQPNPIQPPSPAQLTSRPSSVCTAPPSSLRLILIALPTPILPPPNLTQFPSPVGDVLHTLSHTPLPHRRP